MLSNGEYRIEQQEVITIDADSKLKRVLVLEDDFFKCFKVIEVENGNLFSPSFIKFLNQKTGADS